MSKILHKCLSLVLVVMLLASLFIGSTISASADNKTGDGLAAHAMRAYNEGWVYSWGGASPGAVDCSGLIYSYVGSGARVTEDMLYSSPESGYVSNGVPDIPGLGLWQPGHVGVYVGGGMAVDARDEISNICYQSVATKSWVMWFKVDGVSYSSDSSVTNDNQSNNDSDTAAVENTYLSYGSSSAEVNALQERLKELGYFTDNTTEYFGGVTEAALIEFQTAAGIAADGVYDEETKAALMSDNAPVKYTETDFSDSELEEETDSFEDASENQSSDFVEEILKNESSDFVEEVLENESSDFVEEVLENESSDFIEEALENESSDFIEENFENDGFNDSDDTLVYNFYEESSEIGNIQYMLILLGYHHDDITSVYDESTASSVEFFQLDNGINGDGKLNKTTVELISSMYSELIAPEESSDSSSTLSEEKYSDNDSSELNEEDDNIYNENTESDLDTDNSEKAAELSSDNDNEPNTEAVSSEKTTSTAAQDKAQLSVSDGSVPKSPKTGDPLSAILNGDYSRYINATTVIAALSVLFTLVFFFGTAHYWNTNMDKRKQKAKRATTVSVYRRKSM